jgi:flagellar biosynthesis/type III secretory pathway protein FliH
MTLERARIIKATFGDDDVTREPIAKLPLGRRVPRESVDARAEASRIVDAARREADAIVAAAHEGASRVAEDAARDAREAETARLAAGFVALRRAEDARAERDLERALDLATLLAERLVGEGLRLEPARISELAASALAEARGARRVRVDACPDDVDALREALTALGPAQIADIHADAELPRGSLVVHTDLGVIDARLRPQLARLAAALREALK